MSRARNLAELFEIREHNRVALDSVDNVAGTALGRKNGDGDPAVLVFVNRKLGIPWLPQNQVIPDRLKGPRELQCPTDVISIETDRDFWLPTFEEQLGGLPRQREQYARLVDTNPLSSANLELRDQLRGGSSKLTPGSLLGNPSGNGTLACFARDAATGDMGFLTNMHVGVAVGDHLDHPEHGGRRVGTVLRGELDRTLTDLYGITIAAGPPRPVLTVDAAFCSLAPQLDLNLVDPRLPTLSRGRIKARKLGRPRPLDPQTMEPIGEEVLGVGTNRGLQQGHVVAVACDYLDQTVSPVVRRFAELLIVGKGGDEFSDPGDSGKLVVAAETLEPLAIMWGGVWIRQRHGHDLENFTNATDIGRIMDTLGVEIVREIS